MKPAQPNQSVENSLTCLIALVLQARPMGSRELSRYVGMEHTRVNRLLKTLCHLGLTEQNASRKYLPGPGLHLLSAMSLRGSGLLKVALPHLRALTAHCACGVALGVLWRTHVGYLYHGNRDAPVETAIGGHGVYPAVQSSIGRILLAQRDPQEVRGLLRDQLSTKELETFLELLAQARQQGWALADPPSSLAVAVGEPPQAGLAVLNACEPVLPHLDRLIPLLEQTATRINEAMKAPLP